MKRRQIPFVYTDIWNFLKSQKTNAQAKQNGNTPIDTDNKLITGDWDRRMVIK